ncbi:pyridoxamine 5'-phosphate oxidase family protein [Actinomadura hibisca]|uniref:pyridoxamine 5'-phosphate oxidase family protein n=1 Tax=Actinomadura hibisca TaxID=68565 RepID=UPI00083181A4|nr:pyridoxamine 5'-phosphate oxidase family protein [Actinomadura hibisca]
MHYDRTRYDRGGLEVLDADQCRSLLAGAPLGRIVFTDRALPAVQPVNFSMRGGDIVIRTSASSRLAVAARNAVVAFEADEYDAVTRSGWSVVVVGHARPVTGAAELAALGDLPLSPWIDEADSLFLRIRPETVSGRRIPPRPGQPRQPGQPGRRAGEAAGCPAG